MKNEDAYDSDYQAYSRCSSPMQSTEKEDKKEPRRPNFMHISVASCPEAKNLEAGEDWSRLHSNNN